jgi:hypothetical protein
MQICLFPTILAIFFGGYNYPGMSWVVELGEYGNLWIWCFYLFKLCVHISICGFVGLFQDLIRSIDAFGLEDLDSIGDH